MYLLTEMVSLLVFNITVALKTRSDGRCGHVTRCNRQLSKGDSIFYSSFKWCIFYIIYRGQILFHGCLRCFKCQRVYCSLGLYVCMCVNTIWLGLWWQDPVCLSLQIQGSKLTQALKMETFPIQSSLAALMCDLCPHAGRGEITLLDGFRELE